MARLAVAVGTTRLLVILNSSVMGLSVMEGTAGHPVVVGYSDAKQTGVMVLAGTT